MQIFRRHLELHKPSITRGAAFRDPETPIPGRSMKNKHSLALLITTIERNVCE